LYAFTIKNPFSFFFLLESNQFHQSRMQRYSELHEAILLEKLTVPHLVNKLPAIMNVRRLQCSQEQAFGTSLAPDEPTSPPHMLLSCYWLHI